MVIWVRNKDKYGNLMWAVTPTQNCAWSWNTRYTGPLTEATDSVFADLQLSTCSCFNDVDLSESIFPRSEGTQGVSASLLRLPDPLLAAFLLLCRCYVWSFAVPPPPQHPPVGSVSMIPCWVLLFTLCNVCLADHLQGMNKSRQSLTPNLLQLC